MVCIIGKPSFKAFRDKMKKFIIMRRLGVVKKRVKIVKNPFHNSVREKVFKKFDKLRNCFV